MRETLTLAPADFEEIKRTLEKILKEINSVKKQSALSETWLDNQDVCQMLHISKRTLQNYRDNGVLAFSQIGSKIYYKASDIDEHLNKHYVNLNANGKWN